MSRQLPFLAELQPELTLEVSPELARERGLEHMAWAHVVTSRTALDARVMVTDRLTPLRIADQVVHQVWLPYHWGHTGLISGDVVNDLMGIVVDPNTFIQESKVSTCDVRPGRRPRGAELLAYVETFRERAHITTDTNAVIDTVHAGAPSRRTPEDDPAGSLAPDTEERA